MEIISLRHTQRVIYDKLRLAFLRPDDNLLLFDQFHQINRFSISIEEYGLSKESIIRLRCDEFAEMQFEDVWLIFSRLEKIRAREIFAALKNSLPEVFKENTPGLFKESFYQIIDSLERTIIFDKQISAVVLQNT